tara:strand:- start:13069 stop:13623 length:555 start_codon:yes stop_codon:yes gene_type:complete
MIMTDKVYDMKRWVVCDPTHESEHGGEPEFIEYDDYDKAKAKADKVSGCILDSRKENIGVYTSPTYKEYHSSFPVYEEGFLEKFTEEDTHITNEYQNYNVTTLIQYASKLFRVYTHIDNSVTYQSHGKLEYFNGSDFITISTFSHAEINHSLAYNNPCRSEEFKEKYRKLIETYEKFMPHEESK